MNRPAIQLEGNGTHRPQERVYAQLAGAPMKGEVRLFWATTGRGTREVGLADAQKVGASGHVELAIPKEPYSISGTLVSIEWALEWLDDDGDSLCTQSLIVSPTRSIIELGKVATPRSSRKSLFRRASDK